MRQYKLDRSAFSASTFEEANNNYSYWQNKTLKERLEAAYYLITTAYNYSPQTPPELDRSYFTMRKLTPHG